MHAHAIRIVRFTLIELLVVVSLVAVVFSFLMQSMSESRIKAKLTACQGNLASLAQSLASYQGDHDGTTVVGWDGSVADASQRTFWTKLKSYYGAEENRMCPANELDKTFSYGLYGAVAGRKMADHVPNPAGTVYIGENTQLAYDAVSRPIDEWERESHGDWELGYAVSYTSNAPTSNWTMRRPLNPFVHRPMVNLAFCDGHVEAVHYALAWGRPHQYEDVRNIWDNK